jgi:nitroreductase
MDVFEAIAQRRSIRAFKDAPIPRDVLMKILEAGTQAPSGKNAQPWRFVVVQEDQRDAMVHVMREGIAKLQAQGIDTGSAEWTAKIMAQAPVTVLVFNAEAEDLIAEKPIPALIWEIVNVQSIGASIQNMLLAAHAQGVGSLWIGDIFSAYPELYEWLNDVAETPYAYEMVAAVSFGYPDEQPSARPRKPVDEVTQWL